MVGGVDGQFGEMKKSPFARASHGAFGRFGGKTAVQTRTHKTGLAGVDL